MKIEINKLKILINKLLVIITNIYIVKNKANNYFNINTAKI